MAQIKIYDNKHFLVEYNNKLERIKMMMSMFEIYVSESPTM